MKAIGPLSPGRHDGRTTDGVDQARARTPRANEVLAPKADS